VTSREENPRRQSMGLDDAPCGLARTSATGTFLEVNRTLCLWLGYPPQDLVGKRRFQDLLSMGGRIFHQTHWAPLLQMQGSLSEVKLELLHADGTPIPMVLNAMQRVVEGATVHELSAFIARDRDKYERELVLSRKRLEQLVAEANRLETEAKDHALAAEMMIGIVSHDLRNPMASIQMATALLASNTPYAQQRTLDRITRSAARATALIADLLDFTQARMGKGLSITRERLELHDTVAAAVDDMSMTYPNHTLRHERVGEGDSFGDANRLAQLIGNLVSNAVTYGTPGVPVTVRSTIRPDSFLIEVHNGGAPIPPEIQAEIFRPMSRGTQTSSTARSVGLGLFIVSEIAKAHGGSAHVASSAEAGTTFSVVCPS
jgi:sigma-B regulation protein RsbU (phosphoserine phosphatase)